MYSSVHVFSMKRPAVGLSFISALLIVWTCVSVLLGSAYPLEGGTDTPQLRFVNEIEKFKFGFNWHNVSCAVCKAIFTTVDIALLVRPCFVLNLVLYILVQNNLNYCNYFIIVIMQYLTLLMFLKF